MQLGQPGGLEVAGEVREDADHDHEVEGTVLERERRQPGVDARVDVGHVLGEPRDRLLVDVGRRQGGLRRRLSQRALEAAAAEVVDVAELPELIARALQQLGQLLDLRVAAAQEGVDVLRAGDAEDQLDRRRLDVALIPACPGAVRRRRA